MYNIVPTLTTIMGLFTLGETIRYKRHLINLKKIPNRIHVNGSRGKSSVTRLIGAVLNGDGRCVVVKTTGTSARFIYPDGKEVPVFRPGKANILEQIRIINKAAKLGADTVVLECMAITPEYIRVLEDRIVKSTVGVITNVREDHLDVMGPTIKDVAENLALSLPTNGVAFTTEDKWFDILEKVAVRKHTALHKVDTSRISDTDMEGFPYIEHKENVALALAVGEYFGVDKETALERMYHVNPDPGVLRELRIKIDNKLIILYNALAANDPDSSTRIWNMVTRKNKKGKKIVLLVLRRDRPQRTESLSKMLCDNIDADHYIIAGTPTSYVGRNLRNSGVNSSKISEMENPEPEQVLEEIIKVSDTENILVAMGNIVGLGSSIINALRKFETRGGKNDTG